MRGGLTALVFADGDSSCCFDAGCSSGDAAGERSSSSGMDEISDSTSEADMEFEPSRSRGAVRSSSRSLTSRQL